MEANIKKSLIVNKFVDQLFTLLSSLTTWIKHKKHFASNSGVV